MHDLLFPAPPVPVIPVTGGSAAYPVARIFCVGRNYAAHAAEMGNTVDREAPWYFTKSAQATCLSGQVVPFPPGTSDYHHEVELVVALATPLFRCTAAQAREAVFGYGVGLDMTRRDRQQDGKDNRRPWSLGKDIENGAVFAPLTRADQAGPLAGKRIHLSVNGTLRQDGQLSDMVWSIEEILCHLSQFYHLGAGDLVMTGTPSGVGAVQPGDVITGAIDGLAPVEHTLGPAE